MPNHMRKRKPRSGCSVGQSWAKVQRLLGFVPLGGMRAMIDFDARPGRGRLLALPLTAALAFSLQGCANAPRSASANMHWTEMASMAMTVHSDTAAAAIEMPPPPPPPPPPP